MRIDLAEHSDLVHGTVEMEETSEGVRCSRFPGDMIETFQADSAPYAESALSTSGIRIALVTDSNLIRLRFARGRTFSENGASVDILVDRAECHSFRSDEDAEDFIVNLELDAVEWLNKTPCKLLVSDVYESTALEGVFLKLFEGGIATICEPANLHKLTARKVKLTVLFSKMPITQLPCALAAEF